MERGTGRLKRMVVNWEEAPAPVLSPLLPKFGHLMETAGEIDSETWLASAVMYRSAWQPGIQIRWDGLGRPPEQTSKRSR